MGNHVERVFKKYSPKLNAVSHPTTSWCADTDGFLEHSPSEGACPTRGPPSRRQFRVRLEAPCTGAPVVEGSVSLAPSAASLSCGCGHCWSVWLFMLVQRCLPPVKHAFYCLSAFGPKSSPSVSAFCEVGSPAAFCLPCAWGSRATSLPVTILNPVLQVLLTRGLTAITACAPPPVCSSEVSRPLLFDSVLTVSVGTSVILYLRKLRSREF